MATAMRSRSMLQLRTCALIFIFCAPGLPSAQTAATFPVGGIVQDQTGGVLQNACVNLIGGTAKEQTATTNATGTFRFENARGGSYELRISAEGFSQTSVKVRVAGRAPAMQKVVLQIAQLSQEITVSDGGVTTSAAGNRDAIAIDPE